ncbi:MAG: hypothetical protein ACRERU_08655 [Methylococcales bacterium]
MQTTVRGIANQASLDKTYRFRNLFGLLTVSFLMGCWRFINPNAAAGVDWLSAREYGMNLLDNLTALVEKVKAEAYRSKGRYSGKPFPSRMENYGLWEYRPSRIKSYN